MAESDCPYSFKSLYEAYLSCRRRKRNTINALRFEERLLDNLFELGSSLAEGAYKPARSVCFIAKQPKLREIFAADFRDRVAHHLLVPRLEAIFEPKFIHDSYACRKGKGTHAAVARLRDYMNRVTKRGRSAAWFMQLDIKSFFMSMDKEILIALLARHVRDPRIMRLAETIVRHDCTADFVFKGDPRLLSAIPPHKSLFRIPPGKGLPIGNLTSQFFGNVYLNELDQYVKHQLKAKFYIRYVDDIILLHPDREELVAYRESIRAFLARRLALELKPAMTLKRVSEGADFLGYIVRPDYLLVRQRVVGNLRARIRRYGEEMVVRRTAGENSFTHIHLREETVRKLRQTLASYLGHFRHANAYTLTNSLFDACNFLGDIFALNDAGHLTPLYEPVGEPATLRRQYEWATERYGDGCVFFQVGKFCEFHGEQAERYGTFFGLTPRPEGRLGLPQCGFPLRGLRGCKARARLAGIPYVVVGEWGYYPSGLKKRVVTEIFRLERSST